MANLKRTDVVYDLYYQSTTEAATADRIVTLTAQIRNDGGENFLVTQLNRRISRDKKTKTYAVGLQQIANGSDPLLVAIEGYYRKNIETLVEGLITEVLDFIEGNLDQGSTWMGTYGMKIDGGLALTDVLPADVLAADGDPATPAADTATQ